MRNKANRLEELFVSLVNEKQEIAHDASLLGGTKKHLGERVHRFMRIWVQTLVPPVITMTFTLLSSVT